MRRDLDIELGSVRARSAATRPLAAPRDVPSLRVPQSPQPRRRARRGSTRASNGSLPAPRSRRHEGALPQTLPGPVGLAIADGRFALAQDDGVIVGAWRDDSSHAARRRDRRARLQVAAAPDAAAGRGHDDRRVPDRAGPARLRARGSRRRVRRRGAAAAGGGGGDDGARSARPRCRGDSRRRCAPGCASAAARSCTTASSCR